MKYTIGDWKTRGGKKARVVAENPDAEDHCQLIGWIGNTPVCWGMAGEIAPWMTQNDLIAPWTDPVPWDWSTTPPWINWIAMEHSGHFYLYENEPIIGIGVWTTNGGSCHRVPKSHAPKWSGDWKLSKTQRPKEVAK